MRELKAGVAAEAAYPVELRAPDISAYRAGNTGVPYATTLDSGAPGPHAMIVALMHGNELCGAHTLDLMFREGVRPARGRLTLAFANVGAYARFDPASPGMSRYVDEDMNRVWSAQVLDGPRDSAELRRARALRPLVDTVDALLDLHSMQHGTAPLMLAGPLEKGRAFARAVGYPEHIMCDQGHAAGRRLRDYGRFGEAGDPANALLVECGQHWAADSVAVSNRTAFRFLQALGMLGDGDAARHPAAPAPAQQVIEVTAAVTAQSDRFAFVQPYRGMEVIARAGTVIGHDGGVPVATPYDDCVLIMPARRLAEGQTAVRFGRYA